MAARDAEGQRLRPVIDYPFAEDGLDIWYAMRDWFDAYLRLYYDDDGKGGKVRAVMPDANSGIALLDMQQSMRSCAPPALLLSHW